MLTRSLLACVRILGYLPLPLLRLLGAVLGLLLYVLVASRRRVVRTNLRLCFAQASGALLWLWSVRVFICVAQSWLDRGWLWHAPAAVTLRRLRITGAVQELDGQAPTVLFAPHFVGLDAGWTALTQQIPRRFTTIYTNQANLVSDGWILQGRKRFAAARLFGRAQGVKPILAALKAGEPLYLLPDMNFGPEESVFVPFYGVAAATVPSLARFARLAHAKVVPVVTRMTRTGYEIEILPAWSDFPSGDVLADTALMNARLQGYIDTMPTQYYWVHKRFKDRPAGQTAPY